jgi:hypothetical protein
MRFRGNFSSATGTKPIREGTAKPCQAVDLAKLQEKEGFSDEEAAFLIGERIKLVRLLISES